VNPSPKNIAPPVHQSITITPPEPKVAAVPTGQLNTNNVSIKKLMEKKEEEAAIHILNENLPKETYSFDQVKMLWRRFAFSSKEKGLETLYNAMIKRDPIPQEEHIYVMEVDNQIQIEYINQHLQELINFLRKELKNYSVDITLRLNDHPEDEVKFLTGKDKFAALARKNPNLHTLKNTFNLDIEF
jgi:DNA polymerase-3 subunit gamma/tau